MLGVLAVPQVTLVTIRVLIVVTVDVRVVARKRVIIAVVAVLVLVSSLVDGVGNPVVQVPVAINQIPPHL